MPLNIVLLDDEQHVIDLLSAYCESIDAVDIVGRFSNPIQALNFINNHPVDLLISDINMPQVSGIELAQSLTRDVKVIFITAHSDYAVAAFELDVIDYIVKPVLLPRFLKAISKAQNAISASEPSTKELGNRELSNREQSARYIFVKDGGVKKRLVFDEILFLHAQGDYTEIRLKDKKLLLLGTLSSFQQLLPEREFVRIHRSYIVNKSNVDSVDKDHLNINGQDITIGKTYRQNIDEIF